MGTVHVMLACKLKPRRWRQQRRVPQQTNEVTAAVAPWSIGCILLELASNSEYCRGIEATKQVKALRNNNVQLAATTSLNATTPNAVG